MIDVYNIIEKFDIYYTKYYESISEFVDSINHTIENSFNLNIMCTNIRSLNANFEDLILFLENDIHYKKIDILILTETWHNTVDISYNITGYNTYYSLIKRNQNDGIVIFIKKNFLIVDLYEYDFEESNILKLCVITRNNPIAIYCIYRSP